MSAATLKPDTTQQSGQTPYKEVEIKKHRSVIHKQVPSVSQHSSDV